MTALAAPTKSAGLTLLKTYRIAKGLSLRELGKQIGVTTAACSSWETGRCTPSARFIPNLARALGIEPMRIAKLIAPELSPTEPTEDRGTRVTMQDLRSGSTRTLTLYDVPMDDVIRQITDNNLALTED